MQTTYPLKVQVMRSKGQQPRFYVSFPLALAAARASGKLTYKRGCWPRERIA